MCRFSQLQATSDDPPFLTVGTEVSAKYRGAFCEATIKVAKKLVKCKVSPLAKECLFVLSLSLLLLSPPLLLLLPSTLSVSLTSPHYFRPYLPPFHTHPSSSPYPLYFTFSLSLSHFTLLCNVTFYCLSRMIATTDYPSAYIHNYPHISMYTHSVTLPHTLYISYTQVSYSKGNSALVSNEVVKGSLKVLTFCH